MAHISTIYWESPCEICGDHSGYTVEVDGKWFGEFDHEVEAYKALLGEFGHTLSYEENIDLTPAWEEDSVDD